MRVYCFGCGERSPDQGELGSSDAPHILCPTCFPKLKEHLKRFASNVMVDELLAFEIKRINEKVNTNTMPKDIEGTIEVPPGIRLLPALVVCG